MSLRLLDTLQGIVLPQYFCQYFFSPNIKPSIYHDKFTF